MLTDLDRIVADAFPDGVMEVPYETWTWVATT
jgi:hypothetical protein